MNRFFYGTYKVMKLYLRQDRLFTTIWLLVPGLWMVINTVSSKILFPTQEALVEMGATLIDPLTVAMHGPLLDISISGFVTWRTKVFSVLLCGILSIIYVVRHTRQAEELGRRELLAGNVVGRLTPLAAAISNMIIINIVSAIIAVIGMLLSGLSFWGAFAHCISISAASCLIGVLSGFLSQLYVNSSAARGVSFLCLGLLFVLHICLNILGSYGFIAHLSPFELPLLIRPFSNERFSVLLDPIILILLLCTAAFYMMNKRDLGAGIFREHKGHSFAESNFNSLHALAWRNQRSLLLSWLAGFIVFSFALGCASYLMAGAVSSAQALKELVNRLGGVDKAFMSLILYAVTFLAAFYALMAIGIMRQEELDRGELLLSLPIQRISFVKSHLIYVFGGPALISVSAGFFAGLGAVIGTGDSNMLLRLFIEVVQKVPAIWVIGGIGLLLYGALPRRVSGFSYGILALFIMLDVLWEQRAVPDILYALSPFSWVTPLRELYPNSLILLCFVAIFLTLAGLRLYKMRDILSL